MSYSFRNRPKLSDRYRGKSGDEILNELKNQIDEERKMFFESSPGWNSVQSPGSFSRASHPLDDMMSRGRQDIRSHLDDLAQRHPEFADHLRCPPWGGEMSGTSHVGSWGRKRRGSGSSGDDITGQEPSSQVPPQSEEVSPSRGRPRQNNLPQYGLRNTVDLGQQQQQCEDQEKGRGQRSWSAPPDNRTQNPPDSPRFISRLDIPINAMPNNVNTDWGKPPVAPKQQQMHNMQQQQPPQQNPDNKQSQGSNVRHIPIFVEGRDEPLLSKAAATGDAPTEKMFSDRVPSHTTFNYGRPSQFTARQQQQPQPPPPPPPSQQASARHSQQLPPHAPQHTTSPRGKAPPQQQQAATPQPPKHPAANDPMSCVQAVQRDVDELKAKVDQFSGKSRKDKDYMYLDEMLTRNLLKLDNIETEGKEDLRQARKAVIRNIQQCISILETKVPSPDEGDQNNAEAMEKYNEEFGVKSPEYTTVQNSSALPDSVLNKTDLSVSQVLFPQNCEPNIDVQNVPQIGEKTVSIQNSQLGFAINTEQIDILNKQSGDQPECNNSKAVIEQISGINSHQPDAKVECERNENVKSNNDFSISQQAEMQVDLTDAEPNREQMEVESSCSKETLPVPGDKTVNDEKAKGDGVNKTTKPKSPKGSPKKGKRAT